MRDPLIDLLIRNGGAGVLAGWLTVGLLLGLDVRGLGALVLASDVWPLPLIMLLAFFAITFGGAAMAAAIMGLGRESGAASNPLARQTRIGRIVRRTRSRRTR